MTSMDGPAMSLSKTVVEDPRQKVRPGIELGNLTDVGCQRTHNEDYYCYAEPDSEADFPRKGRLAVIADGMGGHRGGQVASGIAVESVRSTYLARDTNSPEESLAEALHAAHLAIRDCAQQHPEFEGMGTTCIAAVLRGSQLHYIHVGDSRLYLLRNSSFTQLTQDHTVVNRLLQEGQLTPTEAAAHPERGVLTAALGVRDTFFAEAPEAPIPLEPGDLLLMCTDGLHDLVEDHELAAIAGENSPSAACRLLIDLARSRGGFDNMTVQILKFLASS
jgi:serine/threonine protein phosphatase PrpC